MNRDLFRKAGSAGLLAALVLMAVGSAVPATAADRVVLCEEFTATW